MAAPNLLAPTTITGKTVVLAATTSSSNLLVNSSASGKALKVNAIVVTNVSASAATITLQLFSAASGGTATHLAKTRSIDASTTVTLLGRDIPVWLEEDRRLAVTAGTGSALEVVCSYEDIS